MSPQMGLENCIFLIDPNLFNVTKRSQHGAFLKTRPVNINTFNQHSHLSVISKIVILSCITIGSKNQLAEAFHRSKRNQACMRLAIAFSCKNSKPPDFEYIFNICFDPATVTHICITLLKTKYRTRALRCASPGSLVVSS